MLQNHDENAVCSLHCFIQQLSQKTNLFVLNLLFNGTVSIEPKLCRVDDRMINEYGTFGGMRTGRGNRSTWRKPAPVQFYTQQIPHNLTMDRTQAAELANS
jgi:hypothetical protein